MGAKRIQQAIGAIAEVAQTEEFQQFRLNARDFLSARERGESSGTQISQVSASMADVAEILNRSFSKQEKQGHHTNVISPVVMPKDHRSYSWLLWAFLLLLFGIFNSSISGAIDSLGFSNFRWVFFGPHYWLVWFLYIGLSLWRNSFVMIPDGCQALITKFGKVEATVDAGRTWLIHPRKKVSYIVNVTKEYPYNAPIREAPTSGRISASVDLFLQFKIEDPSEFIFTLGGVNGFSEKLLSAISEVTRSLIYEQKAEEIYNLVGETTQSLLESLNRQFLPAVRFVNANITHAEPSSQEYRMDLAAAEVVRVAKEAYTYQYELALRKEQDEGELNKELATLRETLSDIRAETAKYQAAINMAREQEVNRANAYARRLMIEAESEAQANAALLEAQALDIRAVSHAKSPEILEYRYQQKVLDQLESAADDLPQIISIGESVTDSLDFMAISRQLMGVEEKPLYTDADLNLIKTRMTAIKTRIKERYNQLARINDTIAVEDMGITEEILLDIDETAVVSEHPVEEEIA